MPFGRYNVLTLIGNAIWCFALAGVGWAIGRSYESFNHGFRYVEIVVVALPNHMHVDAIRAAAEAGKAIVCTKPLARNAEESAEIVRIVTEAEARQRIVEKRAR